MAKMTEQERKEYEQQVAEWLAKGNKITVLEPGERSDTDFSNWGNKKKKATEDTKTKAKKSK